MKDSHRLGEEVVYLEDIPVPTLSYMKIEYLLETAYSAKLYSVVFTVGIQ